MTRIIAKLEEIDFKGLTKSVTKAVDWCEPTCQLAGSRSRRSRSLDQTMPKVDEALVEMRKLATSVGRKCNRLTTNLEQTSDATREAMQQAAIALKQTDGALKAAEAVMTNVNGIMDQDSPTFYEFRKSMREVAAAARTLRLLSSYIERNPRALIFGKPENAEGR